MSYVQFKIETHQSVLSLITPGCYLASLDLKDAYYSVPIHSHHTKFVKFIWKKSAVKGFCTSKWSKLWPKYIYKIDEIAHSYRKIRWSYYCNLY